MTQPAKIRSGHGARRVRVLEEAAKILNSHGVSHTSLNEIAKRIGVSRAALYYYFGDQEDLVFQSYRRSCEIMARCLSEAVHEGGGAMAILQTFVDGLLDEAEPEFASLSEVAYLRPEQRSTISGLYEAIWASLAAILKTGTERGELRPCSAAIMAQAILGLVSWIPTARRWRSSDPLSRQDLVDAIKEILREGISEDRYSAVEYQLLDLSPNDVPVDRIFNAEALAAARQEALFASASWLFNLKGVDATSLEEIAERMGVTKKVIYHNVGDKETLVVECYRRAFRLFEEISRRILSYDGPRIAAICASSHAFAGASLREDIAPLAPVAGFESLPGNVKEEINASAVRLMEGYLQLYADGQREGTVRQLHTRAIVAVYPAVSQWLPKWLDLLSPEDRDIAPRELTELLRIGLLPVQHPVPTHA
jgi:AcrR family transcriptional regulator